VVPGRARYQVTIDGRTSVVELDGEGPDGLERVRVDGQGRWLDARALGGGAWSLLGRPEPIPGSPGPDIGATGATGSRDAGPDAGRAAGGPATVRVVRVDGALSKLTVVVGHPDGEPRSVTAEVSVPLGTAATSPGPGTTGERGSGAGPVTLRAPIPGKIVKIAVRVGERVASGQALVVLEAMKMENEIRSPRDGEVQAMHVREGQSVDTAQELVSIGS
jgi:biotin carboxyl carrier protein